MNDKTKAILNSIGIMMMGVGIGMIAMDTLTYSSDKMINECNTYFGVGKWNVSEIDGSWYCTGLEVQYFDVDFDCVAKGVCNVSELPNNYSIDLTNRNLTIISKIP